MHFPDVMFACFVLGVFVLMPILLIMTSHQRKMAEIIHRGDDHSDAVLAELRALRMEVAELRSRSDPAFPVVPSSVVSEELRLR